MDLASHACMMDSNKVTHFLGVVHVMSSLFHQFSLIELTSISILLYILLTITER
jgi:hypothetical protein